MKKLSKAFKGGMSGFTLIEMLIVIAIIAILAGIVLTGVRGFQSTARDTKRIGDTRNIQNLLELHFTRNGEYPADLTELDVLGNVPSAPAGTVSGSDVYTLTVGSGNLSYCITAVLENANSAAVDDASGAPCPTACNDTDGSVFCATSG